MSTSAINTQASILDRALGHDVSNLSADTARYFLSIRLDGTDEERANELAEKARSGTLTVDEQAEIDEYRRVGRVIEMLKMRAKIALNQAE